MARKGKAKGASGSAVETIAGGQAFGEGVSGTKYGVSAFFCVTVDSQGQLLISVRNKDQVLARRPAGTLHLEAGCGGWHYGERGGILFAGDGGPAWEGRLYLWPG
jgi:hypothetical protein